MKTSHLAPMIPGAQEPGVEPHGRFGLIGNHISGFDEKDSTALSLKSDPFGRVAPCSCRDNVLDKCANLVTEDQAAPRKGN